MLKVTQRQRINQSLPEESHLACKEKKGGSCTTFVPFHSDITRERP